MTGADRVVYIAERLAEDAHLGWPATTRLYGHCEKRQPLPRVVEAGPGWDSAEDAIEWARARAAVVMLRLGSTVPQVTYSAGSVHPDQDLPLWPASVREQQ